MSSPTTIAIVLHGLIALYPQANQMTALMVDARQASTGDCMAPHHPALVFDVADTSECSATPGCTLAGVQCTCTELSDRQIDFEYNGGPLPASIQGTTFPLTMPAGTTRVPPQNGHLPASAHDAIDLSYVANLSWDPFDLTLDPATLGNAPPAAVLATMTFNLDSAQACNLYLREDQGQGKVVLMTPRKLGTRGALGEISQPMAQMVLATLAIPTPDPNAQGLVLHLAGIRDQSFDAAFRLLPSSAGYRVDFTNDTDPLSPDAMCDDGVDRHFAMFYGLTTYAGSPDGELVPHVKFVTGVDPTTWHDAGTTCGVPDFNPQNRPACPMAILLPAATASSNQGD